METKKYAVVPGIASNSVMWWKDAIIYELYVDLFAGTFRGLSQKIDYFKTLGVNCLHILPHYPSPMVDDGYDISDYRNVREGLGSLEDFNVFVGEAHKAGIRVMIDFVLNHTSVMHPWFTEARSSLKNPKRNYYLWSRTGAEYPEASNPFSSMKPSNWIMDSATGEYYFSTFYPEQADVNWNNPEVFSEMMRIVDFWVSRGVDGFRLDAVPFLIKKEGAGPCGLPETHMVLKKIRSHISERYPNVVLLAEAHETIEKTKEYFGQGDECHLAYQFSLIQALLLAIKRGDPTIIEDMLRRSSGIPDNCSWATFLRNHDEISLGTMSDAERKEMVTFFNPEEKYRFTTGISMRLMTLFKGDTAKVLNMFRTLFNVPGSPIIYYGEEIGMENIELSRGEKDTRRAVRGVFDWASAEKQMKDPSSLFSLVSAMCHERALKA